METLCESGFKYAAKYFHWDISFVCQRFNWIRSQPVYAELLHPQMIGALVRDVNWGKYFNYSRSDAKKPGAVHPVLVSQTTGQDIEAAAKLTALRAIDEVLPPVHPEYEKV